MREISKNEKSNDKRTASVLAQDTDSVGDCHAARSTMVELQLVPHRTDD